MGTKDKKGGKKTREIKVKVGLFFSKKKKN